jgi:hypothetical protein
VLQALQELLFLKVISDISSFNNASGGHLIYSVKDNTVNRIEQESVLGQAVDDPDSLVFQAEQTVWLPILQTIDELQFNKFFTHQIRIILLVTVNLPYQINCLALYNTGLNSFYTLFVSKNRQSVQRTGAS